MTELRQRRGPASETAIDKKQPSITGEEFLVKLQEQVRQRIREKVIGEGKYTSPEEIDQAVNEELDKQFKPKNVVPGIKNETKKAKDALAKDPSNMELIFQLGNLYIEEEKFTEASNVLIRGWKRVKEIPDAANRYLYLRQLCDVSLRCGKFRQAHAIMKSIEEPEDQESLRNYCILQCRVCCENGDRTEAMKPFYRAIKGATKFEEGVAILAELGVSLKKCGAYDVAKDSVVQMASSEEDKLKLSALERIIELQESVEKSSKDTRKLPQRLLLAGAVVGLCIFLYILHWLEKKSLQSMNMKPLEL